MTDSMISHLGILKNKLTCHVYGGFSFYKGDSEQSVLESGQVPEKDRFIKKIGYEKGVAIYMLGSGKYHFETNYSL